MMGVDPDVLPQHLVGWWQAADGKAVLLERTARSVSWPRPRWLVTIAPDIEDDPYLARTLAGSRFALKRRPALLERDNDGLHLQIEGGSADMGPTYWLYPGVQGDDGRWRNAELRDDPSSVTLLPTVASGLYGTWDDDLTMPWSLPLLPFTRVREPAPPTPKPAQAIRR